MTRSSRLIAASLGCIAAPAAAQFPQFPLPFPQPYPQQTDPYGYPQGYGYSQNPVTQIIDQLLGNRYNRTDRAAVSQCATAALAQASAEYGGYGYQQGTTTPTATLPAPPFESRRSPKWNSAPTGSACRA